MLALRICFCHLGLNELAGEGSQRSIAMTGAASAQSSCSPRPACTHGSLACRHPPDPTCKLICSFLFLKSTGCMSLF